MKKSNSHLSSDYRLERKPDMSQMTNYVDSYNVALTEQRHLDRYRTVFSSRLNIFDNARTVEPSNKFGVHHIPYISPRVRYSPAGMDMVNSREITGQSFTKPFVSKFPQNLNFTRGT